MGIKDSMSLGKVGADLGIQYLTDDLTERAVRFIRECDQNKEPFFLYFPHFAVHSPREAKLKTSHISKVSQAAVGMVTQCLNMRAFYVVWIILWVVWL